MSNLLVICVLYFLIGFVTREVTRQLAKLYKRRKLKRHPLYYLVQLEQTFKSEFERREVGR